MAREEPLADPASPQDGDVFQLGEMIEFASMKITYMDVKIVDSLEKSSGGVFSGSSVFRVRRGAFSRRGEVGK
ncbi:MAG TPA: hypothetical protein VK098_04750 [Beutenbergiaceae bacterium]|nr:hypothetical protein [Beutenbergiaceae bacterium]